MGRASPTPPISSLLRALKVVPSRLAPPSKPLHAKKPSWSPAYLASSPPPGKAGPAQQQGRRMAAVDVEVGMRWVVAVLAREDGRA